MDELKARACAIETRLRIGLQSTEYIDVFKAISMLNIGCIKRKLESNMSGATIKINDNLCMVLVNSAKTLGHQNFTVAHELYHCLYDDGIKNRACMVEVFSKRPAIEQIAENYAVHLLMPEDGVLNQLKLRNKINEELAITDIVHLEQFFGVSRRAICWRLEELKLISKKAGQNYLRNVIQSAKRLGKSTVLYESTDDNVLLSDYAEKASEALEKGLITPSRYENILADAGLLDLLEMGDDLENA